jgi:queuine tRNA-ribosyltransferase
MTINVESVGISSACSQGVCSKGPELFSIVSLGEELHSVRSERYGETFHPKVGPQVEARCVYFQPMQIMQRLETAQDPFCVWDIGLGSAGNILNLIREHRHIRAHLDLHSFDMTLEPLLFAIRHAGKLPYLEGFESILEVFTRQGQVTFTHGKLSIQWHLHLGDLRDGFDGPSSKSMSPDAVMYDPYSPLKNPELWSLPAFSRLRHSLVSAATLATYSRSTSVRVALLLAGFFVGQGGAVGEKEETTVAATQDGLIDFLLDEQWLAKVRKSTNAEPMTDKPYQRGRIKSDTWKKLVQHPQFVPYSLDAALY